MLAIAEVATLATGTISSLTTSWGLVAMALIRQFSPTILAPLDAESQASRQGQHALESPTSR